MCKYEQRPISTFKETLEILLAILAPVTVVHAKVGGGGGEGHPTTPKKGRKSSVNEFTLCNVS